MYLNERSFSEFELDYYYECVCSASLDSENTMVSISSSYPIINISSSYPMINISNSYPMVTISNSYPMVIISSSYPMVNISSSYPMVNISRIAYYDITQGRWPYIGYKAAQKASNLLEVKLSNYPTTFQICQLSVRVVTQAE